MECGDTPHFIISIWIHIWIWIWSVGLHGVLQHSTLHNIHMDTDMDMDMEVWIYMECGDILHSIISIWTWIWFHDCILSLLHTLDIKIDLFKIGTILFIIIQGF